MTTPENGADAAADNYQQPPGETTIMNRYRWLALAAYIAAIPLANWMISNVGTQAFPDGPHTIPVGFGYDAPSGVLAIGFSLAARDAVHRWFGYRTAVMAIAIGVVVSFWLASPALATASALAFALGELADLFVYAPLRRRNLPFAVLASGVVGAIVDSLVFLQVAFGSTMFWQGQVIGKTYVAAAAALAVWGVKRCSTFRDPDRPTRPSKLNCNAGTSV